jgi:predicted transcriptional regulator
MAETTLKRADPKQKPAASSGGLEAGTGTGTLAGGTSTVGGVRLVAVDGDFFRFLKEVLPRVGVRTVERVVRRPGYAERRYETHYYVEGHEVASGLLVYDESSPLGSHGDLLYVPDGAQLESLRREYEARRRAEAEERARRDAELRREHEARLQELLQQFEEVNRVNCGLAGTLDPHSEIDMLIYYYVARPNNARLTEVIQEIKHSLIGIEWSRSLALAKELERRACYIEYRYEPRPRPRFIPLELNIGRGGEVIGRERTYAYMLYHTGAVKYDRPVSVRALKMFSGRVALFKTSPPKLSDYFVIAVRYVEKPNVLLVYEYVRLDPSELLAKRNYLKMLESKRDGLS